MIAPYLIAALIGAIIGAGLMSFVTAWVLGLLTEEVKSHSETLDEYEQFIDWAKGLQQPRESNGRFKGRGK